MFTKQDLTRGFTNAGWLIAGNYASQALSMLTMVIIARKLGPAGYGMFSTATAFVGLFSVFHLNGFDRVFIRHSVSNPDEERGMYPKLLGLKALSGVLGVIVVVIAVSATNFNETERVLVLLFSITMLTQSINALLTSIFQIHEQMYWLTVGNLLRQAIYVLVAGGGLWWGLFPGEQVIAVMSVLVGTYMLLVIFYSAVSFRYIGYPLRFSLPSLPRDIIKSGLIFSASTIVVYLYTKIDILMARAFLASSAVGLYAVCMNTVDRITSPINVVMTAFFPAAVRRIHAASGTDVPYVRRISVGFGVVAIGIAFVGTLLATWLVPLVFGEGYSDAVLPMRILLWAMVPTIAMMPFVSALQAAHHEDLMLRLVPLRAVLNVMLDIVALMLGYGVIGIAAGSVITSVVFNSVFLDKAVRRLESGIRASGGITE